MSACAENRPLQSASVLDCGDTSPLSTTRQVALFQLVAPESDAGGSIEVSKMSTRTAIVTLLLAIVSVCLYGYVLNVHSSIFREFQVALLQEQWMLLICLAIWFSTFIFLSFRREDVPLIALLLIAIAAFFISQAASHPAMDAIILLACVTFGKGTRFLLRLKAEGEMLKDGEEMRENMPDFSLQPSAFSIFLIGLVVLLAFGSLWHLDMAANVYRGPRWMGLWNNPNTYGMLMATGVVLTAGLLAASSKSKVQSLKLAESAEENTVTDSSPDPSSPKTHLNRPLDTFSPSAAEKGNLLRSLRSFVAIKSAILLVAAGMMAVGLFFSYSRGAWLGTAVGLLYLAKVYGKFKWRYVVLGAGLVALGALLIWGRTPDDAPWYLKRMDLSRPSAQHRIAAWSGAVQMMRDHPLGVGWNKAAEIYGKNYSPPEGGAAAITTNDYLMLGTQLGFPGLLCFVSYVALRLKSPKSKVQGPKSVEKSEIGNRKSEIANRQDACATLDIGRWTLDARLRIACRSAAIAMLVAFWFDGGLFKLATAAVFWILLELGNSNAEGRMKNAEIDQSLVTSAATKTNAGFTLVELLVVIAIIGILAALLMPVLSRAKLKGQQATCLNNLKQLQVCWQIYADDNQDTLARNIPGDPKSWINGQTGNMNAAASATNVSSLSSGLLFPYNKSYGIYKCPSARGPTKNTQDPSARSSGLDGSLLVRTCSITARLGNTTDHDCLVDSFIDPSQGVILKLSGIKNPGPANASVFIDESVTTVDDGFFAMGNYNPVSEPPPQDSGIVPAPRVSNPDPRSYQNSPSIRHGGSSMTLSFADGHVGLFRFTEGETEPFLENGQASVPDSQKQDWINFYSTIYPYP